MSRLPDTRPAWYLRPWFALQRRRLGAVPEPLRLWARAPRALLAFLALFRALRPRAAAPVARLRALVAVRVSQLLGCAYCIDLNGALLLEAGADGAMLARVAGWREESGFTTDERLALEYAEAVTATPPAVDDALLARLRAAFGDDGVVELTAMIGLQNLSARFNAALGAAPHGFCRLQ